MALESSLNCASAKAPSPENRKTLIDIPMCRERIQALAKQGKRTKIFEALYNVMGLELPVNNIGYHEKGNGYPFPDNWGGLRHAHALFQGLKRPMTEDGYDARVYVYIVKPRFQYEFIPHMVCCAKRIDAPQNAVFAVYVLLEPSPLIINWEWIIADKKQSDLPKNYSERYDRQIW